MFFFKYRLNLTLVAGGGFDVYKRYSPAPEYQRLLRTLYGQFVYRLDTNYAKIDRIEHAEIEHFKTRVLNTVYHGMTIKKWSEILSSKDNQKLECALKTIL